MASLGIEPSTTSTKGSSSPRSAFQNHSRKSSAPPAGPHSKSMSGQCTAIFGSPGSAPSAISSMLGCVAAVKATESPSQLKPALIQRTWIKVSSALMASGVGTRTPTFMSAALSAHSPKGRGHPAGRLNYFGISSPIFSLTYPTIRASNLRARRDLPALSLPDPSVPGITSVATRRGERENLCDRIDHLHGPLERLHLEVHVGQEIDLVDENEACVAEHVRVLEGFVRSLGHRRDDHPILLSEVEHRRTDQIADVLDEDGGPESRI